MEANFQPRMKRKDFEDADDDFSDFPFSSPATKIRRLDAELPPIMIVDEEPEVAAVASDQPPEQSWNNSGGWKIEEFPNEERAIVLYNPSISITTPIVHSPSNFSVSLHPQFISGLKNQILRAGQANSWRLANDEDDSSSSGNGCQAVVPWFPPRFLSADACQIDCSEMMDDEEMGEATMDVEDSVGGIQQRNANEAGTVPLTQWQPQQHCTIVQPPHNTTTPIGLGHGDLLIGLLRY